MSNKQRGLLMALATGVKLNQVTRMTLGMITLCALPATAVPQDTGAGPLVCMLQADSYPYSGMTVDPRSHIHFVLLSRRAGTDIYEDWNSWGYFTRTFTVTDSQSRHFQITRTPPLGWDRNFPSVITLNNGQVLVTDIYLCDGSWRVSPKIPVTSGQKLTLIGRFKQERDNGVQFGNPWIGNIDSAPIELMLGEGCVTSLNSSATTGVFLR